MTEAYAYPLLIKQLLHTPLASARTQRIIHGEGIDMSYAEFAERLAALGQAFSDLGIGAGSMVAVMDWDSHRYLECFFAIPMLGATLHTVNVRLSPQQILYTINHAEDDVILVHEDFLPLLLPLLPAITRPVKLILLSDNADRPLPEGFTGEYEALRAAAAPGFRFADFDENTRATLFYTTGTTGDPKGVSYSHRQLVLHTLAVAAGLGAVPGMGGAHRSDVYMPLTPLFHVHAWGIPYVATLLGLKQVYPGRYEPARLLGLIAHHKVSLSHCVPTILAMLLNAPGSAEVDLSGWKVVIGGAALPEGLAQAAVARGIDVHAAYGMSETCPFLTMADMVGSQAEGAPIGIRTATGRAAPMVDLRVVDPEMRDVPHDGKTTGEIVARAPWLTQGYHRNDAASEALWAGGYLHTGDVGHMAPDGTLRITDRLKDVIKSGGEWISSLELENLISVLPGVAEVAAVGLPDPKWSERPALMIATAESATGPLEAAARAAVATAIAAGRLSRWAAPERVEFVTTLPKTSVGKIDKKAIRASMSATN